MIEQAKGLIEPAGTRCACRPPATSNATSTSRASRSPRPPSGCVKAREALGDDVVLGIDYHHRLSVAEAASFCQKMPSGTLDFLEEPIRDETPEAYESLRTMTDMPFAIGEEFAVKWQFLPYIERGIHQFNRIDVCNVGGLTEAMKVAGWSEAHYVDMMPHNPLGPICTAATVHFAAAVRELLLARDAAPAPAETHLGFDNSEFFPVQPRLERRRTTRCATRPASASRSTRSCQEASFKFWEAPQLRRRDGSVTNW